MRSGISVKEIPSPETALELAITQDPAWIDGMQWGKPRPGHPEGSVGKHTIEVLANVDRFSRSENERRDLRLIALLHDCCKAAVESRTGVHHAVAARQLAESYLDDPRVLTVIEHHDDAFRAYRYAQRGKTAETRVVLTQLVEALQQEDALKLFLAFFRCDITTGSKSTDPYYWFAAQVGIEGDA